ncbi:MAG: hypothetical protein N2662_06770 [Bacteroidales bacterium]|nr:hypothetical protein [Bacteroidales bacterium]
MISAQSLNDSVRSIFVKSDIGFLVGTVNSEMKAPFSFMTSLNYKAGKKIYIGAGTGLEFFQNTYVPVYLVITTKPFSRSILFSISGGYTIPLSREATFNDGYNYKFFEGYFINPEISYFFSKKDNLHAFVIAIGYRYQRTDAKRLESELHYYYPYHDYSLITVLNRFSIRFGYLFY